MAAPRRAAAEAQRAAEAAAAAQRTVQQEGADSGGSNNPDDADMADANEAACPRVALTPEVLAKLWREMGGDDRGQDSDFQDKLKRAARACAPPTKRQRADQPREDGARASTG